MARLMTRAFHRTEPSTITAETASAPPWAHEVLTRGKRDHDPVGPPARAAVIEQPRLRALALQIEFVLRHTTNLEHWFPKLNHGLENRWLEAVPILGIEPDGRARAMLCLEIDWTRHDTERNNGRFTMRLAKDKHPDGATNLITATTGWFRDV